MATAAKAAPKAPAKAPARAAAGEKAAPKQGTLTLKQIANELVTEARAQEHGLKRKHAEEMLGEMVELMAKHLKKGDRIRIPGLGILVVRKRPARMGRNPATGESIKIKASKKIAFRPAKELKERV